MEITALTNNNGISKATGQKSSQEDALRKAASQFEAVLLMQLTSVLNSSSDDKNKLFGKDGGTGLAKKMFSEQLATAMSEAGGIGLAETILKQFGIGDIKTISATNSPLSSAISAIKDIKNDALKVSDSPRDSDISTLIDRSGKTNPVINEVGNANSNEAQIISTYANERAKNTDSEQWREPFSDKLKGVDYTNPKNMSNNVSAPSANTKNTSINPSKVVEFEIPVKGRISSNFGNRFHPIDKKVKFHGGLDIAARRGTPIAAAADGIVTFSGRRGGYGNMVIIEHSDGKISRYAHADRLVVKKGQEVYKGQKIATVGSTGKATGPHVHFEVRENNFPIDPKRVFSNVLLK